MNFQILLVFIIYGLISDWLLRKKLKIDRGTWSFYHCVNSVHKWAERIIFIGFIISIWFIDDTFLMMVSYFFILYSLRAFMEWKHERHKREYLLTLFSLFNLLIFVGILAIFTQKWTLF
jgi:hypothetical protein